MWYTISPKVPLLQRCQRSCYRFRASSFFNRCFQAGCDIPSPPVFNSLWKLQATTMKQILTIKPITTKTIKTAKRAVTVPEAAVPATAAVPVVCQTVANSVITIKEMSIPTIPIMARIMWTRTSIGMLRIAPTRRHIPSANPQRLAVTLYPYPMDVLKYNANELTIAKMPIMIQPVRRGTHPQHFVCWHMTFGVRRFCKYKGIFSLKTCISTWLVVYLIFIMRTQCLIENNDLPSL